MIGPLSPSWDPGRPLSLAAGDFDNDGIADLVVGHLDRNGGRLVLHEGNPIFRYPKHPGGQRGSHDGSPVVPFFSPRFSWEIPVEPEILRAGDFDRDGFPDLLASRPGERSLFLLAGDGRGGFLPHRELELPGILTALVSGRVHRTDGMPELAVGIEGPSGPEILWFDSAEGGIDGHPERYPLSSPASILAMGRVGPDPWTDLVAVTGDRLWLLEGRSPAELPSRETPRVPALTLPEPILAIAAGAFRREGSGDLAILTMKGRILTVSGETLIREAVEPPELFELAMEGSSFTGLAAGRIGSRSLEDLILLDPDSRRLQIRAVAGGKSRGANRIGDPEGGPIAVLPIRLNGDAFDDLVVLQEGSSGTWTAVTTTALAAFTVTTTADSGGGSLRQAILDANASIGLDDIAFNLPGPGPHVIQPLSPLPVITDPVTIDATTQPGFAGTPVIELDGSLAGDGTHGLVVASGSTTIRGLAINRFGGAGTGHGVVLEGSGGDLLEGNHIGTDPTGQIPLPNTGSGVRIDNVGGNTVGGTFAASRNLISGNGWAGVWISGGSATANLVKANFIGTRVDADMPMGNSGHGVLIDGAPGNDIGGVPAQGAPHVISANGGDGIRIRGTGANGNLVDRNFIGTDPVEDYPRPLGNGGAGIRLLAGGNTIGGTSFNNRNQIGFNGGAGVSVINGTGNRIRRNRIFENGGLGIDLGDDGVTPNDVADPDPGANLLQNHPVLFTAVTDAFSSSIDGTLNSTPNTIFAIEFFTGPSCDPSGHGEGSLYFIAQTLTTDGAGNANFDFNFFVPLPVGVFVTATATDPAGNSSEYSACVRVSDLTPGSVGGVEFPDASRIDWLAEPDADSYNVYRGLGPFVPNLLDSSSESCLRFSTSGTTTGNILSELPPVGSFYWFLVVGVNGFGEGSAGEATAGIRSLNSFGGCTVCPHDKCAVGPALPAGCDPCVTAICSADPSCCSTQWDQGCVDMVRTECGSLVCDVSRGSCPHPQCVTGEPLSIGCDNPPVIPSCVDDICALDPVCCTTVWDTFCVTAVADVCGLACD